MVDGAAKGQGCGQRQDSNGYYIVEQLNIGVVGVTFGRLLSMSMTA